MFTLLNFSWGVFFSHQIFVLLFCCSNIVFKSSYLVPCIQRERSNLFKTKPVLPFSTPVVQQLYCGGRTKGSNALTTLAPEKPSASDGHRSSSNHLHNYFASKYKRMYQHIRRYICAKGKYWAYNYHLRSCLSTGCSRCSTAENIHKLYTMCLEISIILVKSHQILCQVLVAPCTQ